MHEIIDTYHVLHKLAEPSWHEEQTACYLSQRLIDAGLVVSTYPNHYGFIAEIPGKSDTVIALRADMDALVQEVDGHMIPNHSCGHDAHSTMVLYTALTLAAEAKRKSFPNTLRFLFQPAEEVAGGAKQMMRDGALDNVAMLFGVHLRPWMEVADGQATPVILHRSSTIVRGKIKGKAAHAARPHAAINPLLAAMELVRKLETITLPAGCFSATLTSLSSGQLVSANVIPESSVFTFDLRTDTNEQMIQLQQQVNQRIQETMLHTRTEIEWEFSDYVPATIRDQRAIDIAQQAIIDVLGAENLRSHCQSLGGEDFHFYAQAHPEIATTMIGLGCDLRPGLHDPYMSFNTSVLISGTQILTALMKRSMERAVVLESVIKKAQSL